MGCIVAVDHYIIEIGLRTLVSVQFLTKTILVICTKPIKEPPYLAGFYTAKHLPNRAIYKCDEAPIARLISSQKD